MYKAQKGGTGRSTGRRNHSFSVAQPGINRERSTIDRNSSTISAIDGKLIYPMWIDEVLPGDTFQVSCEMKAWLATPQKPFLDQLLIDVFFWFVPNRLVWEDWHRFQGEEETPGEDIDWTIPQMEIAGGVPGINKIGDYYGLPHNGLDIEVCAFPFRGYNLIWSENYRDQNLQDRPFLRTNDSNSTEAEIFLRPRGRRKDYITSALPWPQKGEASSFSLGDIAPVVASSGDDWPTFDVGGNTGVRLEPNSGFATTIWDATASNSDPAVWNTTGLEVDLGTASLITINQLRQSVAIQQLLELDARAGTRLVELIKARFGVSSPDARHQRPEYLGGGTVPITVAPVAGTVDNSGTDIGQLGAVGSAQGNAGGFTHSFTEHGYVHCLINLRASNYRYFEGVNRHWKRQTRFDYYEPGLAHLGEQAIFNAELVIQNDPDLDYGEETGNGIWGFGERFSEYKFGNSMVTSIMRPNIPSGLGIWSLAEQFGTMPTLNAAWVEDNPPIDRVIAVPGEPAVILDMHFANKCTRVMPIHNTPGLTRL